MIKKLFSTILFLCFLLSGSAYSQILKLKNCYSAKALTLVDPSKQYWTEENWLSAIVWVWDNEKQEKFRYNLTDIEPNERFELFKSLEESSFSIKLDTGVITETKIYSDFFYKVEKL